MPKCSVEGCENDAAVEVRLYDKYHDGVVFDEQDFTCPFLCQKHADENERRAKGSRSPRGITDYPLHQSARRAGIHHVSKTQRERLSHADRA